MRLEEKCDTRYSNDKWMLENLQWYGKDEIEPKVMGEIKRFRVESLLLFKLHQISEWFITDPLEYAVYSGGIYSHINMDEYLVIGRTPLFSDWAHGMKRMWCDVE